MLCFRCSGGSGGSTTPIPTPPITPTGNQTPSSINSPANSPNLTINLRREYTLAVQSDSYNEIWSKIHHHQGNTITVDTVLQPDRSSIQELLGSARVTPLSRLVSRYLDSSEHTSHFFVSLRQSVDRALAIYEPIGGLLELLQDDQISQSQCDWAFARFQEFDNTGNPFQETGCNFDGIRVCLLELKQQLDERLGEERRRQKVLRCTTLGSAYCLLASAAAVALTGVVIGAHALVALVAVGPTVGCFSDPLAKRRRRVREHMAKVDAAARETFVLNNKLDSIERLVSRLHATVESDKVLIRLVLERGKGKGQRHLIMEAVKHLRKNHSSFMHQIGDLDVHIVLCLAAVNRARALLIQQIHR